MYLCICSHGCRLFTILHGLGNHSPLCNVVCALNHKIITNICSHCHITALLTSSSSEQLNWSGLHVSVFRTLQNSETLKPPQQLLTMWILVAEQIYVFIFFCCCFCHCADSEATFQVRWKSLCDSVLCVCVICASQWQRHTKVFEFLHLTVAYLGKTGWNKRYSVVVQCVIHKSIHCQQQPRENATCNQSHLLCVKAHFLCSAKHVCTSVYSVYSQSVSLSFSCSLSLSVSLFVTLGLYHSVADVNFSSQYLSGFSYVHTEKKRFQASLHDGYSGNARSFCSVCCCKKAY